MQRTVLWLSNLPFTEKPLKGTGSWLSSMGEALIASGQIKLANISQAKVRKPTRRDCGNITQWVVPFEPLNRDGLPPAKTINAIQLAVEEIKPDLLHVWGTENYWGLLTARSLLSGPALLEMQGIKYACAKVFYGGLSLAERLRCIGPLEVLRPHCFIMFGKQEFERWGKFEKEMLLKHRFISTQSDWVRAQVRAVNHECTLFKTGIALRKEFTESKQWSPLNNLDSHFPQIFTSTSSAAAYKGLHVLLRALALIKKKYPQIVLNIAGRQLGQWGTRSGYSRWLLREANKLGIKNHIRWLGPLDADGILQQFYKASVLVVPSFVESYCLSLAEAMMVGVPTVVSYAGALPEMARDDESTLYFSPGDVEMCAWQIERLLCDHSLARRISERARSIGIERNSVSLITCRQIQIYDNVISGNDNRKNKNIL